jgi:hypothetical protein
MSNFNKEYYMLYVEGRKSFEMRREKENYDFAVCRKNTRQTIYFAVCQKKSVDFVVFFLPCVFVVAHGKMALCRVPDKKHTAKTQAQGKLTISGSEWNHSV